MKVGVMSIRWKYKWVIKENNWNLLAEVNVVMYGKIMENTEKWKKK